MKQVDSQNEPVQLVGTKISVERYFFVASCFIAVVFAWLEPDGASGIGVLPGVVFWITQFSILIPLLIFIHKNLLVTLSRRITPNPWLITTVAGVVGSIIFSPIAFGLDYLFGIPEDDSTGNLFFDILDELTAIIIPITVSWLGLNVPWILRLSFIHTPIGNEKKKDASLVPSENPAATNHPKDLGFSSLVRRSIGGEIVSMTSELHYVNVKTTVGKGLLLYNLSDAISELDPTSGIRIHRSHWVARSHITKLRKVKNGYVCELSSGEVFPVSRRRISEVRDKIAQVSKG
jgi:hypothetical protein